LETRSKTNRRKWKFIKKKKKRLVGGKEEGAEVARKNRNRLMVRARIEGKGKIA